MEGASETRPWEPARLLRAWWVSSKALRVAYAGIVTALLAICYPIGFIVVLIVALQFFFLLLAGCISDHWYARREARLMWWVRLIWCANQPPRSSVMPSLPKIAGIVMSGTLAGLIAMGLAVQTMDPEGVKRRRLAAEQSTEVRSVSDQTDRELRVQAAKTVAEAQARVRAEQAEREAEREAERKREVEEQNRAAVLIEMTKTTVAGMLKDPGSASFARVHWTRYRGKLAVCGEVSGRNGFGGYGERMKFVSLDGQVYLIGANTGMAAGKVAHYEHCND